MSLCLKRKCTTSFDSQYVRNKRIRYYSNQKVPEKSISDLPLEILTMILQYSANNFYSISQLKYVSKTWYTASQIVEFYLCEKSWWTIFKVSRYVDSYDKVMVACLGNCSTVKPKYYDFCWTGVGGENSHNILKSLQGTYHAVYNSHSHTKVPRLVKIEDNTNKILQACTLECLYMSQDSLMNRIRELEEAKELKKLNSNTELDCDGEYDFTNMSRSRIREVLGDYDYTQYNESEDENMDSDEY